MTETREGWVLYRDGKYWTGARWTPDIYWALLHRVEPKYMLSGAVAKYVKIEYEVVE